jgi:hypothetical protein
MQAHILAAERAVRQAARVVCRRAVSGEKGSVMSVRGWLVRAAVVVAGAGAGVWAGVRIAPDVPAVAAGLAVSGASAGVLVVLLAGWRRQGAATRGVEPLAAPEPPAAPGEDAPEEAPAPQEIAEPEPPPPGPDAPPGWYPDPDGAGSQRYWDGSAWSGHVWRARPAPVRRRRAR